MIRNANDFGAAMRRARKRLGINQTELAARCGVHLNFVSDMESGKPTTQLEKALVVAVELGFLFPSEPGAPDPPQEEAHEPADDADDDLGHLPSF
jgi:HTH-type transcriptional regulator/antitoxin HipB